MGIEPTYPAWKAGVLPLNYTRVLNYNTTNQKKIKWKFKKIYILAVPFYKLSRIKINMPKYIERKGITWYYISV